MATLRLLKQDGQNADFALAELPLSGWVQLEALEFSTTYDKSMRDPHKAELLLKDRSLSPRKLSLSLNMAAIFAAFEAVLKRQSEDISHVAFSLDGRVLFIDGCWNINKQRTFWRTKSYFFAPSQMALAWFPYETLYFGFPPLIPVEFEHLLLAAAQEAFGGTKEGGGLLFFPVQWALSELQRANGWRFAENSSSTLVPERLAPVANGAILEYVALAPQQSAGGLRGIPDIKVAEILDVTRKHANAEAAIDRGDYETARAYYDKLRGEKFLPRHVRSRMAMLSLTAGDNKQQLSILKDLIQQDPNAIYALNMLAALALMDGKPAIALESYKRQERLFEQKEHAGWETACCRTIQATLLGREHIEQAMHQLASLAADPKLPQQPPLLALVDMANASGDFRAEASALEKLAGVSSNERDVFTYISRIARIHFEYLRDFERARDLYHKLANSAKRLGEPLLPIARTLAGIYAQQLDFKQAVRWYEKAAECCVSPEQEQTNIALHKELAEIAEHQLKDIDAACRYYKKLVEMQPQDKNALAALQRISEAAGHTREAAGIKKQMLNMEQRDGDKAGELQQYVELIALHQRSRELGKALAVLWEAWTVFPDSAELCEEARRLIGARPSEQLASFLVELIAKNPQEETVAQLFSVIADEKVWHFIAVTLRARSLQGTLPRFASALLLVTALIYEERLQETKIVDELLTRLLAGANGESTTLLAFYKSRLYQREAWHRLIAVLRLEASKQQKRSIIASLYYEIGEICLYYLQQPGKAEECFEKALKEDIDSYPIFKNLRNKCLAARNAELSWKMVYAEERLIANPIFTPYIFHVIGTLHLLRGDYEHAEAYLKKAISSDSDNLLLYERMGELYVAQQETLNAIRIYNKLYQMVEGNWHFTPTDGFPRTLMSIAGTPKKVLSRLSPEEYVQQLLRQSPIEKADLIEVLINYALGVVNQYKFVKLQKAQEYYEQALSLLPSHAFAVANLATLYHLAGNHEAIVTIAANGLRFLQAHQPKEVSSFLLLLKEITVSTGEPSLITTFRQIEVIAKDLAGEQTATHVAPLPPAEMLEETAESLLQLQRHVHSPETLVDAALLVEKGRQYDRAYVLYSAALLYYPKEKHAVSFMKKHKGKYREVIPAPLATDVLDEFVVHASEQGVLCRVMRAIGQVLSALYYVDILDAYEMNPENRLADPDVFPVRKVFDSVARFVGMEHVELYSKANFPEGLALETGYPPSLILSIEWLPELSQSELRFLFAKYLYLLKASYQIPLKLGTENFRKALLYLCKYYFSSGVSDESIDTREFGLFAKEYKKLSGHIDQSDTYALLREFYKVVDDIDFESYYLGLEHTSNRVGLLASNDVRAAVNILKILEGDANWPPQEARTSAEAVVASLKGNSAITELLKYVYSDAYAGVRKALKMAPL